MGCKATIILFRNYVAESFDFETKEWKKTNIKFPERIEVLGVCQLGSSLITVGLDSSDARSKLMPLILYKHDKGKWVEIKKIQNIEYSQKLEFSTIVPKSDHEIMILFKSSIITIEMDDKGLFKSSEVHSDPEVLGKYKELKEFNAHNYKGVIYLIGGTNMEGQVLSQVTTLDPGINKLPEMKIRRQGASVAELNGLLYVAGGYNYDSRWLRSVECYNPASDTWTLVAHMNHERYLAAMVAYEARWTILLCFFLLIMFDLCFLLQNIHPECRAASTLREAAADTRTPWRSTAPTPTSGLWWTPSSCSAAGSGALSSQTNI